MKKRYKYLCAFTLLLCFAILLSSFSLADSFSFRNGVVFGMTLEEVKDAEKDSGLKGLKVLGQGEKYKNVAFYEYYTDQEQSIIGFDKAKLSYYFDKKTDKLYRIQYSIYDENLHSYNVLLEALEGKYGMPISDSLSNPIITPFMDQRISKLIKPSSYSTISAYEWRSWLVQYDEYYVEIDTWYCKYENREVITIGYRAYQEEEVNAYYGIMDEESHEELVNGI